VRDFELYIEDVRYGTPTLSFVQMSDERRVREFAQQRLDEDKRHRGIEVREHGVRLFGLGTLADPPGERCDARSVRLRGGGRLADEAAGGQLGESAGDKPA
jgi:hypothetical protein